MMTGVENTIRAALDLIHTVALARCCGNMPNSGTVFNGFLCAQSYWSQEKTVENGYFDSAEALVHQAKATV